MLCVGGVFVWLFVGVLLVLVFALRSGARATAELTAAAAAPASGASGEPTRSAAAAQQHNRYESQMGVNTGVL